MACIFIFLHLFLNKTPKKGVIIKRTRYELYTNKNNKIIIKFGTRTKSKEENTV